MIVWKKQIRESEDCGEKNPPVCTYIAECFIKIAEHLSYRPNFMNYPFREDMVGDVYLWTAIASGALMLGLSVWVTLKPMEKAAWTLFKFSSPYLAVLFIALMVDSAL